MASALTPTPQLFSYKLLAMAFLLLMKPSSSLEEMVISTTTPLEDSCAMLNYLISAVALKKLDNGSSEES